MTLYVNICVKKANELHIYLCRVFTQAWLGWVCFKRSQQISVSICMYYYYFSPRLNVRGVKGFQIPLLHDREDRGGGKACASDSISGLFQLIEISLQESPPQGHRALAPANQIA